MTEAAPALLDSFVHAIAWWLALVVLNLLGWFALRGKTAGWHDRGWALARPCAMLALAFAIFVAAHVVPIFRADGIRLVVAFAAVVLLLWRRALPLDRATWRSIAASEARFVIPFALYLAMRGLSHDIIGLEKFMDYAFLAAALRVDTAPVPDPWFAGESLNYYYFGHFLTAVLCKFSGTPGAFGYNLMLATLFGLTFQLAWAFVAEMTARLEPGVRRATALLAGAWLTLGGNVHGFFYGFVKPWLVDAGFVERPRQAFLVSDPTRFVGWDPPTEDKLIHEFPAYAFYVGDLHAHLINLPFVLLFCCVLLAWWRARDTDPAAQRGWLITAGGLTGIFAMANSWDAAMYGAMLGALLVFAALTALPRGLRSVTAALSDGLVAALAAALTALPFLLSFRVHSEGFFPTHSSTPAWQWLVLYGLQTFLAAAGCALALRKRPQLLDSAANALLVTLTAFGIAFALVPEFVYLKDIYGGAFYRGNTAFKFGFQAFVLLTLASSVGVAVLLSLAIRNTSIPRAAVIVVLQLALVPPFYYGWFVLQGSFGVWNEREWTLDGQRYLALSHPEDRAACAWLVAHAGQNATLIEAVGDSYTYAARISANTGIPAVLGWPVHEQLWRGSDPEVWTRRDDINRLYETASPEVARSVIERYDVHWLVVGRYERERYGASLDPGRLAALGRVAFRSGETFIVDVARTTTPRQ